MDMASSTTHHNSRNRGLCQSIGKAGRETRSSRKCRSTGDVWTPLQRGQPPDKLEKSVRIHRSADRDSRQKCVLSICAFASQESSLAIAQISASRPGMANHRYPGWRERLLSNLSLIGSAELGRDYRKERECRNELRTPARKRKPAPVRKTLIYPTKADLTGPKIRIQKMMTARVVANKNSVNEPLNRAHPKFTIQDGTGFCRIPCRPSA
jgi:hypothetical protein